VQAEVCALDDVRPFSPRSSARRYVSPQAGTRDLVGRQPVMDAIYGRRNAFRVTDPFNALRLSRNLGFASAMPRGINETFGAGLLETALKESRLLAPGFQETARAISQPHATRMLVDAARLSKTFQTRNYTSIGSIAASRITRDISWLRAGRGPAGLLADTTSVASMVSGMLDTAKTADRLRNMGVGGIGGQFGLAGIARLQSPFTTHALIRDLQRWPHAMPGSFEKPYSEAMLDVSAGVRALTEGFDASTSIRAITKAFDISAGVRAMTESYDMTAGVRALTRTFDVGALDLVEQILDEASIDSLHPDHPALTAWRRAAELAAAVHARAGGVGATVVTGARYAPFILDLRLISLWPKLDASERQAIRVGIGGVGFTVYLLAKGILEEQSLATVVALAVGAHIALQQFRLKVSELERRYN